MLYMCRCYMFIYVYKRHICIYVVSEIDEIDKINAINRK